MSTLAKQWKALDARQKEINDQYKGSGAKAQETLATVNYVCNLGKADLERQMNPAELEKALAKKSTL